MKKDLESTSPAREPSGDKDLLRHSWEVVKTAADSKDDENYLSLPVENLICALPVSFDVFVKTKVVGEEVTAQYMICCPQGQVFPKELLHKFRSSGIDRIYIHRRDQGQAMDYLYSHLARLLEDEQFPMETKFRRLYDATGFWIEQFFTEEQPRMGNLLKTGQGLVHNLISCVLKDSFSAGWLLDYCHHDTKLYTHCLNTCVVGLAFTKYLRWSYLKMRDFGLGALLHDIGMTRVSSEALSSSQNLSPEMRDQVQRHPTRGFAMVKPFPSVGKDSLMIILQHHENGDGSGYPEGLKLANIEPAARVMRIIDSYEAMTSPRSWRPKLEPVEALRTLKQDWQEKGLYDKHYLHAFIKFLAR